MACLQFTSTSLPHNISFLNSTSQLFVQLLYNILIYIVLCLSYVHTADLITLVLISHHVSFLSIIINPLKLFFSFQQKTLHHEHSIYGLSDVGRIMFIINHNDVINNYAMFINRMSMHACMCMHAVQYSRI